MSGDRSPEGGKQAPQAGEMVPADDAVIGVALRWSLLALVLIAAVVLLLLMRPVSVEEAPVVERGPIEAPAPLNREAAARPIVRFTDVTEASGIRFVHFNGATGEKLLPETMGGGVAFLDFDGDGDQDLLFVNGEPWKDASAGEARLPTLALYRNDGRGSFEDVTQAAGLSVTAYGMGPAIGDYDGDGDVDLFLACLGPDRLFRNDGGVFREVTAEAGVAGDASAWSTSSGFFDHDLDGDLDLWVLHYVEWSAEIDRAMGFTLNGRDRAYGPPRQYRGTDSTLWRNEGDGSFTDVSADAGIRVSNAATGEPIGKGLALTFLDADSDGRLDVFVANDTVQNFLFRNRGDGTFEELGAKSGTAYDESGMATGAMGVDAADVGNDGRLGIGIANFANESSSFYLQQGAPFRFADVAGAEGIGSPSRLRLSFGLFFFDYDLDGRLDLLQANGHLEEEINEVQPSQHYRQPAQLFWNRGPEAASTFVVVPDEELGDLSRPIVGRGAAFADIDGDGDLDVVLTQAGGPALLLRNDQDLGHHWLRVALLGRGGNRAALGALVELEAGGATQRRLVVPTRSYLSQVELPLTFGLSSATSVDLLRVTWPGGGSTELRNPGIDRTVILEQPE